MKSVIRENDINITEILQLAQKNLPYIGGSQHSKAWQIMREYIYSRDKGHCARCGKAIAKGDEIWDVHHINQSPTDNDPANLVCLCHSCHAYIHAFLVQFSIFRKRWGLADFISWVSKNPTLDKQYFLYVASLKGWDDPWEFYQKK